MFEKNVGKYSLYAIGGVLAVWALIWGSVIGYYPSQAPFLIALAIGGAACLFIGSKIPTRR